MPVIDWPEPKDGPEGLEGTKADAGYPSKRPIHRPAHGEVIYLAGPIHALDADEDSHPLFFELERSLTMAGYHIINPLQQGVGKTFPQYLRDDVRLVCHATAVLLLPDWSTSRGATLELAVAEILELKIFIWDPDAYGMFQHFEPLVRVLPVSSEA